jgi:chromosome segregation ATPase
MVKFANPLEYPLAVLIAGVVLVVGVRVLGLPNLLILPTSAALAAGGAIFLKSREPDEGELARRQLQQELQDVKSLAATLARQAEILREEANQLLASSLDFQLDLLVTVQRACDRAVEFPLKIEQLSQKISAKESLLSVADLEEQLSGVNNKIKNSSGAARQQLEELAASLQRNIQLAKQGKDSREAQVINLHTSIQNSAGVLQQLQNRLHGADLNNLEEIKELKGLSDEFNSCQQDLEVLLGY